MVKLTRWKVPVPTSVICISAVWFGTSGWTRMRTRALPVSSVRTVVDNSRISGVTPGGVVMKR